MKVIFLDIDGVLNTDKTFEMISKYRKEFGISLIEIEEYRVEYLSQIIEDTGAVVVLSSSWRYFFEKENGVLVPTSKKGFKLCEMLKKYNIDIYDITTKDMSLKRKEQIDLWLRENDVDNYLIIDDQLIDPENQIKTNFYTQGESCVCGLCHEHIIQAKKILNNKEKMLKK